MPQGIRVVKDNLFSPPEIFKIIQDCSGASNKEMYEVFNMGCRLEIYTNEQSANEIIEVTQTFGIDAQVIGRVEAAEKNELLLTVNGQSIVY
jgi:phosphoribosylformylglycinamidine cyclo-ligase